MLRKVFAAAVVLVLVTGVALADEVFAIITKVEGGKVTFTPFKGKEKQDQQTLPVVKDVKVFKGKFNKETKKVETGDPIDEGIKDKIFSDIPEKGLRAVIVTDSDNKKITEIRVLRGKKKKD